MFEYKISDNPIHPIAWEEYLKKAKSKWDKLLNLNPEEKMLQKFLEGNPSLIPGAYGVPIASSHAPLYGGVFSQPELPGFQKKFPDFMWIATNSMHIMPILIEIESLERKWFRHDGQQREEFTHAQKQLNDWRIWFEKDYNKAQFRDMYLKNFPRTDIIKPHYLLIFGREKDVQYYRQERSANQRSDETYITYDRLKFDYNQQDYLTLRRTTKEVLAIAMPPTCMIGPDIIEYWRHIKNLPEFFLDASGLSQERKEFLVERFNYGLKWLHSNDLRSHPWGIRE